jgi:hypothetical protein
MGLQRKHFRRNKISARSLCACILVTCQIHSFPLHFPRWPINITKFCRLYHSFHAKYNKKYRAFTEYSLQFFYWYKFLYHLLKYGIMRRSDHSLWSSFFSFTEDQWRWMAAMWRQWWMVPWNPLQTSNVCPSQAEATATSGDHSEDDSTHTGTVKMLNPQDGALSYKTLPHRSAFF